MAAMRRWGSRFVGIYNTMFARALANSSYSAASAGTWPPAACLDRPVQWRAGNFLAVAARRDEYLAAWAQLDRFSIEWFYEAEEAGTPLTQEHYHMVVLASGLRQVCADSQAADALARADLAEGKLPGLGGDLPLGGDLSLGKLADLLADASLGGARLADCRISAQAVAIAFEAFEAFGAETKRLSLSELAKFLIPPIELSADIVGCGSWLLPNRTWASHRTALFHMAWRVAQGNVYLMHGVDASADFLREIECATRMVECIQRTVLAHLGAPLLEAADGACADGACQADGARADEAPDAGVTPLAGLAKECSTAYLNLCTRLRRRPVGAGQVSKLTYQARATTVDKAVAIGRYLKKMPVAALGGRMLYVPRTTALDFLDRIQSTHALVCRALTPHPPACACGAAD